MSNPYLAILMKDSVGFGAEEMSDDEAMSQIDEALEEDSEEDSEGDSEGDSEEEGPKKPTKSMRLKGKKQGKRRGRRKPKCAPKCTRKQKRYLRKIRRVVRKIRKAKAKIKQGKKKAFGYGNLKNYIKKKIRTIKALKKKGGLNVPALPSAFNPFSLATPAQLAALDEKERNAYHLKRSTTIGTLGLGASACLATLYYQSQGSVARDQFGMAIGDQGYATSDIETFSKPSLKQAFDQNKTPIVGISAASGLLLGYLSHRKTTQNK